MNNRQNDTILHIILLINDLMGEFISLLLAFLIRYNTIFGISEKYDQLDMLAVFLITEALINIIMSPVGEYTRRGPFVELLDVVKRQAIVTILVIVYMYLLHTSSELSRLVTGYNAVISVIVIWLLRLLLKWFINTKSASSSSTTSVLVVSTAQRGEMLVERITECNEFGRSIKGLITVENDIYSDVLDYVTHNRVDEVFISLPKVTDRDAYERFLTELVNMGIKVDIDINQFELEIPGHKSIDQLGNYAVVSVIKNQLSITQKFIKRTMDLIGGIVGCIILIPVFIIVAPVIKIDSPGPVIFKQKRVGKNGRIFEFYKFRSMYVNAEERKKELMTQNEVSGLMFKMEDDPRITKVGKFLRKTSIDELPQFYNVLIGDMSLVGTRPPTLDEYIKYEPWQKARLSMKPGITGMWQVSGRSDIRDFDEVVKLDMQYIDNWSLALDIKILLKTVGVVLLGKGSR